jgi:hypothetical protein
MQYSSNEKGSRANVDRDSESKRKKMREIFDLAMDRMAQAEQFEEDERALCVEDMEFCDVPGMQWDDGAKRGRKRAGRPMYEFNRVAGSRNQFVGDQFQNKIDGKVRPAGNGATEAIAKIYEGIIRSIRDNSGSSWARGAVKEMATGGIGAWQICTRYSTDDGWDQEIYLKPVRSAATSVWVDTASIEDVHEDAKWAAVVGYYTPEEFEKNWPDSKAANFRMIGINGCRAGWRTQDKVRVADYYVKEPYKRKLVLMTNGKTYEDDEDFQKVSDELDAEGFTVSRRKTVTAYKVMHYKLSGAEVLDGPNEIHSDFIPVIIGYGHSMWIDGAHYYRGMIRNAKDPQRCYNYERSSDTETGALAPKDPYWISSKQAEGHEGEYARMNSENRPVQIYETDPQNPGPPKRTGAPAVQQSTMIRIQQAADDIMAGTGYFAPSLGDNPMNQSGIALRTQDRRGSTGTYEIADNYKAMMEHTHRVLVSMIPHYYDATRIVRIVGEDWKKTKEVSINEVVIDAQTGEEIVLNDLSQGKYDVKFDTGPAFATKREEAVAYLTDIGHNNPMVSQTTVDIVMKNMDFPGADEAHDRLRKLGIKQGFIDATPEEEQEMAEKQKPNPMQMLEFEMKRAEVEKQVGEVDKLELENDKLRAETAKLWAEVQETLETKGIRTVKDLAAAEQAVAQVEKTIMEANAASAQQIASQQNAPQQPDQAIG